MQSLNLATDGINAVRAALRRPSADIAIIRERVRPIISDVRSEGDAALLRYTKTFDGVEMKDMRVSSERIQTAGQRLSSSILSAINEAIANVRMFHEEELDMEKVRIAEGIICWRETRAIDRVGLYVPGGTAPLVSTAYMLGVPAMLAGVPKIVLCTPPQKDGTVPDPILYVCATLGIGDVFAIGGSQAIAAMAYGTQTVPKVDLIAGPGNAYVTAAKAEVSIDSDGASIDMLAGPSELLVIADATANPAFVAADLLSQAEHDPSSQVILLAIGDGVANRVQTEMRMQLATLPRRQTAEKSLASSVAVTVSSRDEACILSNLYAPEHLSLQVSDPTQLIAEISNAGSVFMGSYVPEAAADYCSGTNHVLPTLGKARTQGGVSIRTFQKRFTVQEFSQSGIASLAPTVAMLARMEGLEAHARAAEIRVKS